MNNTSNKKYQLKTVVALVASVFTISAQAENPAEIIETGTVEVVSSTPLAGVGVAVEKIPSNVQVAKGQEIQDRQSLNLADYMSQNLLGVNVNEAQNNPYQQNVNFRGFTASPLLGTPQGLSVYQDGVRINEPFGDTVNWDLIPQNAIANVALMPGSNPLFGLNTLGGALSVQTKSGEHFPGGGVQAYAGSWGRRAIEGEYGGKLDNGLSYFFAGNKFREDGWRDASPSDVVQGFGKLGWSNEKTDIDVSFTGADTDLTGNGYQSQSLMRAFGYDSIYTKPDNTKNKLSFINGKVSHWLSDELMLSANAYYRLQRSKSLNGDGSDEYEIQFETCDGLGLGAACQSLYSQGAINRTQTSNRGYGGTLQMTWATDRNQFVAGGSLDVGRTRFRQSEQAAAAFDGARGLVGLDNQIELVNDLNGRSKTWSLFLTDTFEVTPRLALTASGRYNHTRISLRDNLAGHKEGTCMNGAGALVECETISPVLFDANGDPIGVAGVDFDAIGVNSINDNTIVVTALAAGDAGGRHTYSRFNPALGLAYSFSNELNAYAGYNEGNRAPSPIETGCADRAHPCLLPNAMAGDPPLKQVVAKTLEAGFRGKIGNEIRWTAGAYRTTNHDDLQFVASGTTGAGFFQNVGKTRRQGLDLGISGVTGDFRWSAGYSFVRATFEDDFEIASQANSSRDAVHCNGSAATGDVICVRKGDKIPGIPEHQLKLRGEWRALPNWTIGATGVAFSDQYVHGNENNRHQADNVNYFGSGKLGGYGVLNLDTRYSFVNTGWQLFAKVNNVFDRKYYTGGLLGENAFTAAGNTFATDANSQKELFLAPGAPRAAWIGVRYDFGGSKKSSASSVDLD